MIHQNFHPVTNSTNVIIQPMKGYIPFTPEGLEKIKEEKAILRAKRPEAVQNLRTAREMGDLSENAAYKVARAKLSSIDSRLRHLDFLINCARVSVVSNTGFVGIGSRVKLFDGKKQLDYKIVGSYESDPKARKISHLSPIGKAIMGKRTGDTATVTSPGGLTSYSIISIT